MRPALLVVAAGLGTAGCDDGRTFTPDAWKTAGATEESRGWFGGASLRDRVLDDLLAHHLTPGMTRDRVIALLGLPDFGTTETGDGRRLTWLLGPSMIDFNILIIEFDGQDRLTKLHRSQT